MTLYSSSGQNSGCSEMTEAGIKTALASKWPAGY